MIYKSVFKIVITLIFAFLINTSFAQQDPQYTQYMYNTMTVNSAYAGQRDVLSITGLYRTQWVGINGAPETFSFGIHSPLRNEALGLGLSIVSDKLGPAQETYVDANFSYSIPVDDEGMELSFGLKGGVHLLGLDWSKGRFQESDYLFDDNVNLFSPTIGAGIYLHSDDWYLGLSVPNFITTEHYNNSDFQNSLAVERLHLFLIAGYVFDLSEETKLKPAILLKGVKGAPVIADISANLLFKERLTLGLAWRWDDALSGLIGLQVSDGLYIGYSYDKTTSGLKSFNNGSHEIMLRFELQKIGRLISPRFF